MNLEENDLRFKFPPSAKALRFDGTGHGLSHCMKAVDFVLESKEAYYFVEVKDPDNPKAQKKDKEKFVRQIKSGELSRQLISKYRDTLIYRWAQENLDKPVHYVVLLCAQSLDAAALLSMQDGLRRNLPLNSAASWARPIAKSCTVLSLEKWNSVFKTWPVSRISESAA